MGEMITNPNSGAAITCSFFEADLNSTSHADPSVVDQRTTHPVELQEQNEHAAGVIQAQAPYHIVG